MFDNSFIWLFHVSFDSSISENLKIQGFHMNIDFGLCVICKTIIQKLSENHFSRAIFFSTN